MRQYWTAPLPPFHTADGAAHANSVALTDISPTPPIVLPANLLEAGSEIELEAHGQFSTTGTPTLLLGFYYGGIAGIALAASAAITTGSAAAAWPWMMRYRGVVRALGSAGSIQGEGHLMLGTSLTALALHAIPTTQALRTVAIDTTAAKSLTVGAQWGTANAANTITCNDISAKLLN